MSNVEKKLPKNDVDELRKISSKTDNPQMKRSIDERLKRLSKDGTVNKHD